MGDVVHVNFGKPSDADDRIVSMTWNLDRSALLVWVIKPSDRDAEEEVGVFYSHAAATQAAADRAEVGGLLVVDHTAIDA